MSAIMRKQVDNVNEAASRAASSTFSPETPEAPEAPDAPGGDAAAEAVLELVHAVMHQFRSLQYQALRDGPIAITHMESKVMGYFARHPDATLSDLAQHSGRDKAQLARLVKGLRERALLLARTDATDRRNVHLHLSDEGHAVQRMLRDEARRVSARAVVGLDSQEQAELVALLQRVNANLDTPG
jgi:DNA-binding MarR family transcriptional regulator